MNPMPKVIIPKRSQGMKRNSRTHNSMRCPYISSLLFLIASSGEYSGWSMRMYRVIEYENAFMMPGIIKRRDHNTMKIHIKSCAQNTLTA